MTTTNKVKDKALGQIILLRKDGTWAIGHVVVPRSNACYDMDSKNLLEKANEVYSDRDDIWHILVHKVEFVNEGDLHEDLRDRKHKFTYEPTIPIGPGYGT